MKFNECIQNILFIGFECIEIIYCTFLLSHEGKNPAINDCLEDIDRWKVWSNCNMNPTDRSSYDIESIYEIFIQAWLHKHCTNCMSLDLGSITVNSPIIVRISKTSVYSMRSIIDQIEIRLNNHMNQHEYSRITKIHPKHYFFYPIVSKFSCSLPVYDKYQFQ